MVNLQPQLIGYLLLTGMLLLAAWSDYRTKRIPNVLTLSCWVIAPVFYLFTSGLVGLADSVMGLGLLLLLTFPFFVVHWMGAGDVKLIAAVGGFVTLNGAIPALLAIVITGATLGLLQLAWHRLLGTTLQRYWMMLGLTVATRQGVYLDQGDTQARRTMPYAISIALGTFIYLVLA